MRIAYVNRDARTVVWNGSKSTKQADSVVPRNQWNSPIPVQTARSVVLKDDFLRINFQDVQLGHFPSRARSIHVAP